MHEITKTSCPGVVRPNYTRLTFTKASNDSFRILPLRRGNFEFNTILNDPLVVVNA